MSRFELVRVYLKEPLYPPHNDAGEYVFGSPTGESALIFDPRCWAHGASWYKLRIEHRRKRLTLPPQPASAEHYDMNVTVRHKPWSFDGRFAFFYEAPLWWKSKDEQHRSIDGRSWCVDVSDQAIPVWEAKNSADPDRYRFFNPCNSGVWSPVDYRVLRYADGRLIIGHPFRREVSAFARVPIPEDCSRNNDIGWLASGQTVFSSYHEPGTGIVIHYRFTFYDSGTGEVIEEMRVRSDMMENGFRRLEAPEPPIQRISCCGIWVEVVQR